VVALAHALPMTSEWSAIFEILIDAPWERIVTVAAFFVTALGLKTALVSWPALARLLAAAGGLFVIGVCAEALARIV